MTTTIEIEHKLLVLSDLSEVLIPSKRFLIHQTYIENDVYSERVRYTTSLDDGSVKITHTIKRPVVGGQGKHETEVEITPQTYDNLLARQKIGALPITKVRYIFDSMGQTYELDHFISPINFWLLEAEVENLNDPLDLSVVSRILGPLVDVTDQKRFASSYISKKPHKTRKEIERIKRVFYNEGS